MAEPFFRVEMMPAKHGDALLVEYGRERTRRLLIDAGPLGAWKEVEGRLAQIPAGDQRVELVVVTHVDTDHIEGMIRLMAQPLQRWPIVAEEIWFNGWKHIDQAQAKVLGGREGEMMSALIAHRLAGKWNRAFGGNAALCGAGKDVVPLADGMQLTMLSPDAAALAALAKDWKAKLTGDWSIKPGDLEAAWGKLVDENRFHPGAELTLGPEDLTAQLRKLLKGVDPSKANGSSIGFIAGFAGKTCMFLGDAHMKVVCASLRRAGCSEQKPLRIDAVKVSHHGSKNNITPEFVALVDAAHWLFSSNGDQHGHPDKEAVEAVVEGSIRAPTLWFNYRTEHTEPWERAAAAPGARHKVRLPAQGAAGMVVPL